MFGAGFQVDSFAGPDTEALLEGRGEFVPVFAQHQPGSGGWDLLNSKSGVGDFRFDEIWRRRHPGTEFTRQVAHPNIVVTEIQCHPLKSK